MLAQNFKTADELRISGAQLSALQKTLVLLETGKLIHAPFDGDGRREGEEFTGHFNMGRWNAVQACGTVCCIAGTAELIGGIRFPDHPPGRLGNLFYAGELGERVLTTITPQQAATALRSYLTTGDARWDLAVQT